MAKFEQNEFSYKPYIGDIMTKISKEKMREYQKHWNEKHGKEYYKQWRLAHPEKCKAYEEKYLSSEEHREKKRASHRKYSQNNREKVNAQQHKRFQDKRSHCLTHYGGNPSKCACCGETINEFLTIDHIDNNGYKHRKKIGSGIGFFYWLIKNNFPENFQVLCFNCNCGRAKTKDKICPHKRLNMDELSIVFPSKPL